MLIVNADDLGLRATMTDATLAAWRAGAVTGATAMVHMPDSVRAATLARQAGMPVGLHLNLTEPFTGPDAPLAVRERQRRAVAVFRSLRLMRWAYLPGVAGQIAAAIDDQLEAFAALYGGPPDHYDGHQHVHVCLNVARSRALPAGLATRGAADVPLGEHAGVRATARRLRAAMTARDRPRPTWFFHLADVHPRLGGRGLDEALALARDVGSSVEVMVHPDWPGDQSVLTSEEWVRTLAAVPLGSYAELAGAT